MKVTIDLDELAMIAGKADKLLVTKEAEEELSKLLHAKDVVEELLTMAKTIIEKKGLEINPNFKSVEGDKVKASYRYFGQKYYLEEDKLEKIPNEMYTKEIVTKYKANSEIIDSFIEKNGGLPFGIVAPQRTKTLSISLKKNDNPKD